MANVLGPDKWLAKGDSLTSLSDTYTLVMQEDGNLVLYRVKDNHPLWASYTNGQDVKGAIMQSDGNLVVYDSNSGPLWASGTDGKGRCFLVLQDDGNLVIYTGDTDAPVWATNTVQPR